MTNSEWFSITCGKFNLTKEEIELIMVNQQIEPEDYVDVKMAKRALCKEFAMLIPMENTSEGGFSRSYNWEAIKAWYKMNCYDAGMEDVVTAPRPKIRNKSNIW